MQKINNNKKLQSLKKKYLENFETIENLEEEERIRQISSIKNELEEQEKEEEGEKKSSKGKKNKKKKENDPNAMLKLIQSQETKIEKNPGMLRTKIAPAAVVGTKYPDKNELEESRKALINDRFILATKELPENDNDSQKLVGFNSRHSLVKNNGKRLGGIKRKKNDHGFEERYDLFN